MKNFLEIILSFVFWFSLILMIGATEAGKWSWVIISFIVFVIICFLLNKFFVESEKID